MLNKIKKIFARVTYYNKNIENKSYYSDYQKAKFYYHWQHNLLRRSKDIIFILIGTLSAAFGLKGFLLPNNFIDGGAVGISLLIREVTNIKLSVLLIVVNAPFILLGIKIISKEFAIKTAIGIILLSVFTAYIPYPQITHDKLLVAVFGGFFLGVGIGMAVRGGGVIDGTEVLAISLYRKYGITVGDVILIINIIIFSVAAYLLSVEIALYSILTYLSASKTVDFIIEGIEELTGVSIISVKADEIRKMIINKMGRGVTIYNGERGMENNDVCKKEIQIVFTVITRLEINRLKAEVDQIDPNAFIFMTNIKDTKGGTLKKRPLKS
jgi:uncharacterized membrane-anchored protein YitT (DUF2179 family)